MNEITYKRALNLAREDLYFSLTKMERYEPRLGHTILFITETLQDRKEFFESVNRWDAETSNSIKIELLRSEHQRNGKEDIPK